MSFNGEQPLGLETTSSFWKAAGAFTLPFESTYWWSPSLLSAGSNNTLRGEWGLTTVGLGQASKQSITIEEQWVARQYTKSFFLGYLGLSVGAVSPNGASRPTFLSGLAENPNTIPSAGYGFTAGASYKNSGRGAQGSMVFGGYDKARLISQQGVNISLPGKQNTTLVVGVKSITYTPDQDVQQGLTVLTKTPNGGFHAVVDSTLPYLVLPDDVCDKFVEKFNLVYDRTTGLYTVNGTAHERNQQQNATVAFKIGSEPTDSSTSFSSIVLPYEAFYKRAGFPIYPKGNETNYFPIRKSGNGVYILGRTFLQEAYIIVDYEHTTLTVAPAYFSDPMPAKEELVPIFNATYTPPAVVPKPNDDGISGGAIAGIVIGIVAVFLLIGGVAFFYYRKRRIARAKAQELEEKPVDIDTTAAGGEVKHRRVSELTGSEPPYSPQTKPVGYYGGDHKSIPELSPDSTPAELWGSPVDGASEGDYFASGPKPRRRGATRDSAGNTPGTPVVELAGDDGRYQVAGQHFDVVGPIQRPKHSRGPSDTSLSTNIDEVLAAPEKDAPQVERKHSSRFIEHTGEDTGPSRAEMVVSPLENTRADERDPSAEPTLERRPSHVRGLSDTTVNSESTAVSQPTPEELERWNRGIEEDVRPNQPLSK
ncbi:acid protease [Ophiobolus disseminans]|uniref:Acid protease n=1 Tax=Ophiobolus disseminans TaxID=1469910 RepID=A0A6A6ZZU6_9PLEO|nr:acid protease [Ophiobolus disseminans]